MPKLSFNLTNGVFQEYVDYVTIVVRKMNERDTVKTWELQSNATFRSLRVVNEAAECFEIAIGHVGWETFYASIEPDYSDMLALPMGWHKPKAVVNVACGPTKMADKLLAMMPKYREQMEYSRAKREKKDNLDRYIAELRYHFMLVSGGTKMHGDWIGVVTKYQPDTHDTIRISIGVDADQTIGGAYYDQIQVHLNKLPSWLAEKVIKLILDNAEIDKEHGIVQDDDALRAAIWRL